MSQSTATARRSLRYPILIAILIFIVVGFTAWTATSSPAMGMDDILTPTNAQFFGVANIAKPTYTALPTSVSPPVSLPNEIITNTPESVIYAEIVDTSLSTYDVQVQDPYSDEPSPASYNGNKYILVDISDQHMYVYEADALVYSWVISTGMNNATRVGTFSVLNKIPNAYGATWNIWMPNWLGIYWAGSLQNGIHALPILPNGATLWEGYLGVPISYGCVVLGTYEAQVLYDWAEVGTVVEIQW
jgi:lipoprotein-anchoring transpeptidase ErfK/SrfK